MIINIAEYGVSLNKNSKRLVIKKKTEKEEVPFFKIKEINIYNSSVSITGAVIENCVKYGIRINFFYYSGRPIAHFISPALNGTIYTKRMQYEAYKNKVGVEISKKLIIGKIKNQQNSIKYFIKNKEEGTVEKDNLRKMNILINEIEKINFNNIECARGFIMQKEAEAAKLYWESVKLLVAEHYEFKNREYRGTNCLFNKMLNYGYGMLYSKAWGMIELAGLDAFAGFMHSDRSGRKGLILDFVEEYRAIVVDRVVIAIVNKWKKGHLNNNELDDNLKNTLIKKIEDKLIKREKYMGKNYKIETIMQMQARRMASFFKNESEYEPFIGGW